MIPGLIAKSPISYGWAGYDRVEVFSSRSELSEYEASLSGCAYGIEKIQDSGECIQYRLLPSSLGTHTYEILAASLNSEDDVWDLESYVGEKEFDGIDRTEARTIGALFLKDRSKEQNESEQSESGKASPATS